MYALGSMKRFCLACVACAVISSPAVASEGTYKIGKGLGIGGLVLGGTGPVVSLVGIVTGLNSASNGNAGGFAGGSVVATVGGGMTAIAPTMLNTGGVIGSVGVHGMGGKAPAVASGIGFAGVATQGVGWGYWAGAQKALVEGDIGSFSSKSTTSLALRVGGWSTGMVAGIVQLAINGNGYKKARDSSTAYTRPSRVQVGLQPRVNGFALQGTF